MRLKKWKRSRRCFDDWRPLLLRPSSLFLSLASPSFAVSDAPGGGCDIAGGRAARSGEREGARRGRKKRSREKPRDASSGVEKMKLRRTDSFYFSSSSTFFSFGLFLCKTTRQLIVQARARAPLSLSRSLDRSTMRIAASTLRAPHQQQQQRAAGSSSDGAALPLRSSRKVGNAAASIIDRRRARCVAGYF